MRRLKRLLKTVNGEKVERLSVLEFQDLILPDKMKIRCMSFPVRPYVPPPLRCYKWDGQLAVACKGVLNVQFGGLW